MASETSLVYYEYSWSILSTIGLVNILYGITIIGITSLSPVTAIPVVVSAAGAVANGLCYYAFYADYPIQQKVVASAFADVFWLIQEAGLSFYSYVILRRVLQHRARIMFLVLFWFMIATIVVLRIAIIATRIRLLLSENNDLQPLVNYLHIGYFVAIAAVEVVSAAFLLRKFARARRSSSRFASTTGLFSYLMRSTEIRLALLALIGITRAITYSFQSSAQSATGVASQLDRFVYTIECLFPVMLMIDILASKVIFSKDPHEYSSQSRAFKYPLDRVGQGPDGIDEQDIGMYPVSRHDGGTRRVDIQGGGGSTDPSKARMDTGNSSTERIIDPMQPPSVASSAISKTVEFEIRESIIVSDRYRA